MAGSRVGLFDNLNGARPMAGSRVGLFDNLNIPIHRDAQHREDTLSSVPNTAWRARQSASGPAVYPLPLAHRLVCGRIKRNTACNRVSRHSRHSSVTMR